MVSTDVMYNGLPFPDEEFTKVTMERDLLIRRAFLTSPILWALLGFIATHRPALCFSSVLLRALCATCLHQWRAKNGELKQLNLYLYPIPPKSRRFITNRFYIDQLGFTFRDDVRSFICPFLCLSNHDEL